MFFNLPIKKYYWHTISITCVLISFQRLKLVIFKNDEENISVCKISKICVVDKEKIGKKMEIFLLKKNNNKFAL